MPHRFELIAVADCPFGDGAPLKDTGREAADYWFAHVATAPDYDPARERFAVMFLDHDRRLIGHTVLPPGGSSFVMAEYSEVFRPAFAAEAASIICIHNHPGDDGTTASDADLNGLRSLIAVGRSLNISVTDYVIVDARGFYSSMEDHGLFERERELRSERPLRAQELDSLMAAVLASAPHLVSLICDAAFKAEMPAHDFFLDQVRQYVSGQLTGEPGTDPKIALAATQLRIGAKLGAGIDESFLAGAARENKSITDFIWDRAVALLKASTAERFETPTAAGVAAAGV